MHSAKDVIARALQLAAAGPLAEPWNEHGEWCTRCLIAKAHGELDEPEKRPFSDYLSLSLTAGDMPLENARRSVRRVEDAMGLSSSGSEIQAFQVLTAAMLFGEVLA